MKIFGKIFPVLMAIGFLWVPTAQAANYTFKIIDVAGAQDTMAWAINNTGQVVGNYGDFANNIAHGFVYVSGTYTTFDFPSTSGSTWANDINDAGQIVGQYNINGFLKVGSQYTTIAVPDANNTTDARGINKAGRIVGFYAYPGPAPITHSFIYLAGVYSTFGIFGATLTDAFSINDSGQIVGRFLDSNYHGFLYDGNTFTYLNFPGATDTEAYKINNHGDIVGVYKSNEVYHGFILKNGKYIPLDFPGAVGTVLTGINDYEQVVGFFVDEGGHLQGFMATPKRGLSAVTALLLLE